MDLYVIYMMSGTSITIHISRLHASIVAHMQDPYSKFHHVNTRTCRLLWCLPMCSHGLSLETDTAILWLLEPQGGMGLDFRDRDHGLPSLHSYSCGRCLISGASPLRLCFASFPNSTYSFTSTCTGTTTTTPCTWRSSVACQLLEDVFRGY